MRVMTTAIRPSSPKKLSFVATIIRREAESVAREIQEELQEMVSPFNSNVDVVLTQERGTQDLDFSIHGNENDTATINAGGDGVSSHDLIKFLDGGTRDQYVGMPDGFSNETFSNSLSTREVDYDRDEIYFLPNPVSPGIEARNWYSLLKEKHTPNIKDRISRVTRAYL